MWERKVRNKRINKLLAVNKVINAIKHVNKTKKKKKKRKEKEKEKEKKRKEKEINLYNSKKDTERILEIILTTLISVIIDLTKQVSRKF